MRVPSTSSLLARVCLLTAAFSVVACAGSVPAPMVQVPLFRQRGQGEAGFVAGPASKRPEIGGTLRYAATDTLRVGASLSGASGPAVSRDSRRDPREQAPKLFADGFVGAEWGGFALRYGALAGAGFGLRSAIRCAMRADAQTVCESAGEGGFVRSYGQLHMAFAPPGPLAVSLALRVPVIVELAHAGRASSTELGTEVALTQTVQLGRLRLDLQPLWSRTRGFAFHVALLLRFAAGS